MAEAENYTGTLTRVEDSSLRKLTEHLLCARQQAGGGGSEPKIPPPSENHYRRLHPLSVNVWEPR